MLEGLRAVQSTWVGKAILAVVMGFIVVSFVIWGIGDIFRGVGSNQVARVGSQEVTAAAFRQAYQNELQSLTQRLRRPVTNEEARRFGLDAQVLSSMISDAVLDDRVQALGLAISDADMARAITSDPRFAGPSGAFDRMRFNSALRNAGLNEQNFVREQRHVYLRQELVQALVADFPVPRAGLDALNRFEAETRSIEALVLKPALVEPIPDPDPAALQSYYDAHKQAFEAPQFRELTILELSPAALAQPDAVSDDDARKLYDEVKDARYGSADQRAVEQIVFPNSEDAAAASAKLKAGTSFADLVAERKLDPKDVDLGTVRKSEIFDPAIADAAFALPLGGTSDPVKGSFGTVLIHVEPPKIKTFDEVKGELKREIATRRAGDRIRSLTDTVENARSSGRTLDEAAKAAGLDTRKIAAVDAEGLDKEGKAIPRLLDQAAVLKAAFASDVGVDNDTVRGRDGTVTWFEVGGIDPARVRPLDEVKDRVVAAWRADDVTKRLADKAAGLAKAAQDGKSLAELGASEGGLAPEHLDGIKRSGGAGLSTEAVARVFDGPVGSVGSAAGDASTRIVFKVLGSVVPPREPASSGVAEDRYRTALSEDVLGAYLARVGAQIGARVNQEALRTAAGAPADY